MNISKVSRPRVAICLALPVLVWVATSSVVLADDAVNEDERTHALAVYLWGASVGGKTVTGSDVEISFKDLASNLEFGAMAAYQTRRGRWSFLADVIYLDVAGDRQTELNSPIGGGQIPATVDLALTGWVVTVGGGYNLYDSGSATTDLVVGARYLDLANEIGVSFDVGLPGLDPGFTLDAGDNVIDAIVGLRGRAQLGDRWFVPWGINAGAGESDFTVGAVVGIGFEATPRTHLALTYRFLRWEFDDALVEDLEFSGPMVGAVFRF